MTLMLPVSQYKQWNSVDDLHGAPAIQSKTLNYGHTELEEEHEKEHKEVERTVTSTIST